MADSSKTEKATPHRRKKAREDGQIVRSREFGNLVSLLAALLVMSIQAHGMADHWVRFYEGLLTAAVHGDIDSGGPVLFWTAIEILRWISPVLLVALVCSVAMSFVQGGLNVAPGMLAFKFERLGPGSRLGQMFSAAALGGLLRSMLPFAAIALVSVVAFENIWSSLAHASATSLPELVNVVTGALTGIIWKSAIVLLLSAALDYFLSWRQNEGKLRMSHDEIKREHKEQEGNPFIKVQIRKRQRAMRARKPLEAAASATMVITNPTHFAVAMKYEPSMAAPEVVAKGQDLLAQKIKVIAAENNVPMIENKPLARALYQNVEVGQSISPDLYQAVAEILVAVLRAQDEVKRNEERRKNRNAAGQSVDQAEER
jgi:flagellar biosynthetic protein FlhB